MQRKHSASLPSSFSRHKPGLAHTHVRHMLWHLHFPDLHAACQRLCWGLSACRPKLRLVGGREKEMLKALAAQEKEVLRMRQREAQSGPRDDLDLEWQSLLDAQRSSSE